LIDIPNKRKTGEEIAEELKKGAWKELDKRLRELERVR